MSENKKTTPAATEVEMKIKRVVELLEEANTLVQELTPLTLVLELQENST